MSIAAAPGWLGKLTLFPKLLDGDGNCVEDEEMIPDLELMRRTAAGDEEAFKLLVERHQASVVGTVAKMLGSVSDADDVAQNVFLRVWKAAPRYQPSARFTTWLMTITRNLVFNELRRRQRASTRPLEYEGTPLPIPDPRQVPADREALQNELSRIVESAIASLPEKARMAVILRRYEGMAYEEIAEVLKMSVSAVKSLLFRARAELREKLRGYLD